MHTSLSWEAPQRYPIPALNAVLLRREEDKGAALTEAELLDTRDNAVTVMLPLSMQRGLNQSRGYRDVDPDNLWQEWCAYKSGQGPFTLTGGHL
ncbi:hypothetical protein [Nocardia brasiliensis]|uniref:hypothetical protein n=1 Tax=Nocardia brasiliensis TaxID=37326 RepID=UPI003D89CC36